MRDQLEADKAKYQHALQQVAEQETTLVQQLTAIRTQGQQLQGAIAAIDKLLAAPEPNRAERRRAKA